MQKQLEFFLTVGRALLILFASILLFSCTSSEDAEVAEADEVYEFSLLYIDPKNAITDALLTDPDGWIPRLEEASNGRIKIGIVYYGDQLIAAPESFDAVVRGTVDITINTGAYTPDRFPGMEVWSVIPVGEGSECLTPSAAAMEVWEQFPEQGQRGFEGAKLLESISSLPNPPALVIGTSDRAIRTLDDFQGLKVAVPGDFNISLLQALGASPTLVPPPEAYTSLQRGILDGMVMDPLFYDMMSLKEVINYQTNIPFGGSLWYIVMNEEKWNGLPADIQDIFLQFAGQFGKRSDEFYAPKKQAVLSNAVENHGLELIDLSPEDQERLEDISALLIDEHLAKYEAQGLPAREMWDAWVRARVACAQ